MATVTKSMIGNRKNWVSPNGNAWVETYAMVTNATGVLVDSDQTTALVTTNVVRLGVLHAGLELHDALALVSDAFTAASTCKLGFQYVDGVDSTTVPQDDDYFSASVTLNALGRYPANNTASRVVTLPKDAYLIATIAGANLDSVGVVEFIVRGKWTGFPNI